MEWNVKGREIREMRKKKKIYLTQGYVKCTHSLVFHFKRVTNCPRCHRSSLAPYHMVYSLGPNSTLILEIARPLENFLYHVETN